jgi:hypothetical protein
LGGRHEDAIEVPGVGIVHEIEIAPHGRQQAFDIVAHPWTFLGGWSAESIAASGWACPCKDGWKAALLCNILPEFSGL